MSAELVFALIGSAGFLTGMAALLHFLNTRKPTRSKTSAEAYQAYRQFVHGAFADADTRYEIVSTENAALRRVRGRLIDLVQDVMRFARSKGATPEELEPFHDRLDDLRSL